MMTRFALTFSSIWQRERAVARSSFLTDTLAFYWVTLIQAPYWGLIVPRDALCRFQEVERGASGVGYNRSRREIPEPIL